jgi:putative glutamine amidotransferase
MKQSFRLIIVAVVILFSTGCNNEKNEALQSKNSIVVMHPTVKNVQTILELIDLGVFPLPSGYSIVGVYHKKGSYDYSKTADYLNKNGIKRVRLVSVGADLNINNIYAQNGCSVLFDSLFRTSKGILFLGGPDLPPATYGMPTNLLTEITDLNRHYLELSFLFHLMGGIQDTLFRPLMAQKVNYPVLGICLGMQSMNVATGGTMIQDIPTEIYGKSTLEQVLAMDSQQQHRNYFTNYGVDDNLIWGHLHQIRVEKQSIVDSLMASDVEPFVWSSHHQCIDNLGSGLKPIAWSMDGEIIESVVHMNYPNVLGVQFHPEIPLLYKSNETLYRVPNEENPISYLSLYSGDKGENFHRAVWNHFAELVSELN